MRLPLGAVVHAVRHFPPAYLAVRAFRRAGLDGAWLRRAEFLNAKDVRRPGRPIEQLLGAAEQAGIAGHRLLEAVSGRLLVEVGCGRSAPFAPFATAAGGAGYLGVDFALSPELFREPAVHRRYLAPALAESGRIVEALGGRPAECDVGALLARSQFVRGGVEAAPLDRVPAGLCVSISCLEHISDVAAAARRIAALSGPETLHLHIVNFSNHLSKAMACPASVVQPVC